MTLRCTHCRKPLAQNAAFYVGMMRPLCEPCADRMVACDHDALSEAGEMVGDQALRFDVDGLGYRVWCCHLCGWEEMDDL